jgi:hypothetical protein
MSNSKPKTTKKSIGGTVKILLNFIEQNLQQFPSSEEFLDILEGRRNENQHSLAYCVFMTNLCKSKFYFARENSQFGSSVIDIGIYFGSILIFTIEAKILPIPISGERQEHEYVYGRGGGIQRFKDNRHGLDNNNRLLYESGVLAYIKEDNFEQWLEKINQWIIDADWQPSELLQKQYFNEIAKLTSEHKRIDSSTIRLHHFWVKVL